MKKYCLLLFFLLSLIEVKTTPLPHLSPLTFSLANWSAKVIPQGLIVSGTSPLNGTTYLLGRGLKTQFIDPQIIEQTRESVTLSYPSQRLQVKINSVKNRLHFTFTSFAEQKLMWPILGEETKAQAIMYPEGEGLYIPLKSKFWHNRLDKTSLSTQGDGNGLSAPFWGYDLGENSLNLIAHDDLLNQLHFVVKDGKLVTQFSHLFRDLDRLPSFEISFALTEADPLACAKNYKSFLIETNQYKTLQEKIKENPNIEQLIGAIHAYVWGDGRTIAALEKLESLGIKRMWLGYEDKPPHPHKDKWIKKQHYVDEAYISKAKDLGYLIGPYDSFHTMQHPDQSDCANDIFDDLYPKGCIFLPNGKPDKGFAGRGCHVSSEALVQQTPANKTILNRIDAFIKTGINSYFLDCDAMGELFDDYAPDHPMNQSKDRENRIQRMTYIARNQNMVLGSESAAASAIPILAFSHGNFSVHNRIHWPFMTDKDYGPWWPPERPKIFFQPITTSSVYAQTRYSPQYRLPLLQAVFHESVIMTDRWEIPHMKFKNLVTDREILELFYGIPSIWSLDIQDIKRYGSHLQKLSEFFNRLHQVIAFQPLTTFKWLTKDHLIQQINFGTAVILTANFSQKTFKKIPPKSLQVQWLKKDATEIYQVPCS